jgi:hypothetical protein
VGRKQSMFGKNIIITDNTDWPTGDINPANKYIQVSSDMI